jgi:tRNA G18 (ribose-2'-O)-methylase SpoU
VSPPRRGPGACVTVDDPDDRRLAPYRNLTDAAIRRKVEDGQEVFVVEGHLGVANLLASSYEVHSMLLADSRADALADLTAAVCAAGGDVIVAPRPVLVRTVGFNLHRGVVALGVRPPPPDPDLVLVEARRQPEPVLALVEGVNDHENLGALFRNAAAFGVAAVLLDATSADPLYRRSIRVSMGHVLRTPWARIGVWPAGIARVEAAGFTVVALTPARSAPVLSSLPTGRPVAVLVGAEGPGLRAETLGAARVRARIPMAPGVDSLNVATAAAIAFHHFAPPWSPRPAE